MVGSAGVAAWIAQVIFWALILVGTVSGELGLKRSAIFLVFWLAGYFGLRFVSFGDLYFTSYVSVLDVVLVFIIFEGDVRIG